MRDLKPLNEFEAGQNVIIREAQDDDPARLKRWRTLGLLPGVTVQFVDIQPLDDLYELCVGGASVQVGSEGLEATRHKAVAK